MLPIFLSSRSAAPVRAREEWTPTPVVSLSTFAKFYFHQADLAEPMISTAPTP